MIELLIEAVVVGIVTVIVGSIVGFFVGSFYPMKVQLPKQCKNYNKYFIMEVSLFFTGFFAHLLFDITGGNKWYCKNGVACKK
tara:strand:+ start:411 stop:659 length:249 start_codon:yes stop_codon:yes gene_type:complete